MATWKFKPFAQDDTKENPIQSQFFTTEEVGNISNGIIREGIQNALDERLDINSPVEIYVTLVTKNEGLEPKVYGTYLAELDKHLSSKDSGLRELPDLQNDRMSLLIFEDFNTKGLRGNPIESEDNEIDDGSKPHNFYYFWRNVGITGKSEDKLGRWGVGKTVFPASSNINSFWGYTIQSDAKRHLLLGQSILRKHNLEGSNCRWGFKPYGYFGEFNDGDYFVNPVESLEKIEAFKRIFKLRRSTEPGLSIVVPFYNEEITLDNLAVACIKQYFFPIIKGNLKISLRCADKVYEINSSNLDALVAQLSADEITDDISSRSVNGSQLLNLFSFTKWSLNLNESDFISLKELKADLQPAWYEKILWADINIDDLINRFDSSGRIAFKVPVKYHNKETEVSKICWFKVFLEKDDTLKKPEDHFIRENITIIDVKSLDSPGIRGIVFIEDKDLSNLLGDSENPAHTQWQKDSQNFKNKYVDGDKCIQFIVKSLHKIFLKLQKPAAGIDREILKDFFYVEDPQEQYEPVRPDDDSGNDDSGSEEVPQITPSIQRVKTMRIAGGVVIKNKYTSGIPVPFDVHAELGYLTTRGNSFRKYTQYDFELDKIPIQIVSSNVDIMKSIENKIEFKVLSPEFEVKIFGFDEKRDLAIRVKTESIDND